MVNDSNIKQVSHAHQDDSLEEITLKYLILKWQSGFRYLLKRWKFLLLFILIGGILGFYYAHNKKTKYKATTTFVLEAGEGGAGGLLGQYSGLASMAGIDVGGASGGMFQGENLLALYKSRVMVQKALLSNVKGASGEDQLLIEKYIILKKLRQAWDKVPELRNIKFNLKEGEQFNRTQDSVLAGVVNDINKNYLFVDKFDKKQGIIEIDVEAENEDFAAEFNNQIVKTVNDFYIQTKARKALQNLSIIQHQTDSVRSVLNGAIFQSASVTDATPNLNQTRQVLRAPGQRSQFNAEANKAILTQLVQNLELAKISLRKETPLIQVIDTPIYPLPAVKIGTIKGIVIGGFLGFFISAIVLMTGRIFKKIMV